MKNKKEMIEKLMEKVREAEFSIYSWKKSKNEFNISESVKYLEEAQKAAGYALALYWNLTEDDLSPIKDLRSLEKAYGMYIEFIDTKEEFYQSYDKMEKKLMKRFGED